MGVRCLLPWGPFSHSSFLLGMLNLTSDTKKDDSDVKEVEKKTPKKTPEITDAKVTVVKVTEEALEEADYEVVEKTSEQSTTLSSGGFPSTPQNSVASLPSLPSASGQLDDGFEVISQRAEEPTTSFLNVDNTVATVEKEEAKEEEKSSIANLKSGVEALLTDLSASAGPEQEEVTTKTTVKEEISTTTSTGIVQEEVQSIGEVQDDDKEAEKTEETMES